MNPHCSDSLTRLAAGRVMARADQLATLSEMSDAIARVYLSPQHQRVNQLVGRWMEDAGMTVWQDNVGNICGRYEAQQPGAPALLLGSHLDTVYNAGRYDGILGVLSAIEVVQNLSQQGRRLPLAIEVVGFADEEGTRFGITLLGSRGIAGSWPADWLEQTDRDGISVAQALTTFGLDAAAINQAARATGDIAAYLELHIEQGPCLERENLALGVVTTISGAHRLHCCFTGEAGHSGTVPMDQRKDALAAAAEWIGVVEGITQARGQQLVATVGTIECAPGAANVIPGEVRLTLDVRGPQDNPLEALLEELLAQARTIAERRHIGFMACEYYHINATPCDPTLQAALSRAVAGVQGCSLSLPSGAGHDAIAIAQRWPVGMLFVRCKGGISHHPLESVTVEDVAVALEAYQQVVDDYAQRHG